MEKMVERIKYSKIKYRMDFKLKPKEQNEQTKMSRDVVTN